MIQLYAKEGKDGPLVCLGLLPENIRRIRNGKPVIIHFRKISNELPDWTLSIAERAEVNPRDPAKSDRHISISLESLDASVKRGMVRLDRFAINAFTSKPFAAKEMLPNLMIFYTEDENKFMADMVEKGMTFGEFRDERGIQHD